MKKEGGRKAKGWIKERNGREWGKREGGREEERDKLHVFKRGHVNYKEVVAKDVVVTYYTPLE